MKAPEIKHYINWLGRVEYRNINCSFTYDETSYAAIDRIFRLLHRLEPGPENTSWELWLRAERGTIEDFGSFEELRADGQVESFEEFETWWHSEFPEEAAWFHFAAGEDQKIGYRAIFLGHRHVLEVDSRKERAFPYDIAPFTAWLEGAVRDTVQMVETGSYQELVERELPSGIEPEPSCAGICGGYSHSGRRSSSRTSPSRRWRSFSPRRLGILWKITSGSHP